MKLSKEEFAKQIKSHFRKGSGLTITEAKAKIKKQMLVDEYNTQILVDNVRFFYTSNSNYCGGKKNGYGKGFYLSNSGFKGGSEIKL
jgi:hypothetical protein